jgi:hypothetical protein
MGYSKSPRAVHRVVKYLDDMLREDAQIEWVSTNPAKLAYQLNDGLHAARYLAVDRDKHPVEPYATYSHLKAKFILRVGEGKVIAEPRDVVPLTNVRAGMSRMTIHELSDVLEIVGAAIKHKAPEMFFPDADEKTVDLPQLYAWASRNGYHIIPSDDGITLTQNDPGDLAWVPGQE